MIDFSRGCYVAAGNITTTALNRSLEIFVPLSHKSKDANETDLEAEYERLESIILPAKKPNRPATCSRGMLLKQSRTGPVKFPSILALAFRWSSFGDVSWTQSIRKMRSYLRNSFAFSSAGLITLSFKASTKLAGEA